MIARHRPVQANRFRRDALWSRSLQETFSVSVSILEIKSLKQMVVPISRPASNETGTGKRTITECSVCEIPLPKAIKQQMQTMYQHETLQLGHDFRKSMDRKSQKRFFEIDQHKNRTFNQEGCRTDPAQIKT